MQYDCTEKHLGEGKEIPNENIMISPQIAKMLDQELLSYIYLAYLVTAL